MVSIDITADFRTSVQSALKTLPEPKRRTKPRPKHSKADGQGEPSYADAYLQEAYAILEHINTLNSMLTSIRHAYLSVDSGSGFSGPSRRGKAFDVQEKQGWEGVKRLTNQERDEIDLQAKVIMKRCMDRVKALEALEAKRASSAPHKTALLRLLPTRLTSTPSLASSDLLAAHYLSITWFLNARLARVSAVQREMQEERVRRQLERARSLGGEVPGSRDGGPGEGVVRRFDATAVPRHPSLRTTSAYTASGEEDDAPLTAEQAQLFELENASILRSAENVLAQVQRAESSLHDISALQSELVHHLTVQSEMTDRLYEEAMSTQREVERGNDQLRKARERGGDARRWLLVFLIGASLALLFVHYYR
ncbi:hypothetical protein CALCODRAFT_425438 [Calocera cornea HHB12733]|uniref:t-SNARE coiled-coil homology domain-containing protein n=1 Tax=Calocera cornea HHB12733 TaxID=1353952 RepID=A0A165KAI1_9BASI|nr:hypothetical protein CALCODRAFT_425438 [Calocera cornea HHB12733]